MQLFVSSPPFLREIHLSVMVQTAGFLWLSSGEAEIVPFDSKERRRGELHETFVPFFFRFGCFQKASKWMVELLKSSLKLMIWGVFPRVAWGAAPVYHHQNVEAIWSLFWRVKRDSSSKPVSTWRVIPGLGYVVRITYLQAMETPLTYKGNNNHLGDEN